MIIESQEEELQEAFDQAIYAAKTLHKQFPMVPHEDILQSLCEFILTKPHKFAEWTEEEDEGGPGIKKMRSALFRRGRGLCFEEKAAQLGCSTQDFYFYTTRQLYELLPDVFDLQKQEYWPSSGAETADKPKRRKQRPAEGGNRVAMLADISRAIDRLDVYDRVVLFSRFGTSISVAGMAEVHNIKIFTMRSRIDRAVRRLQRILGGERPDFEGLGSRKAMSNAKARAITEDQ